jgi:hypothetical protein
VVVVGNVFDRYQIEQGFAMPVFGVEVWTVGSVEAFMTRTLCHDLESWLGTTNEMFRFLHRRGKVLGITG